MSKRGRKRKFPPNYRIPFSLSSDDDGAELSEAREQRGSREQEVLRDVHQAGQAKRHSGHQEAHREHGVSGELTGSRDVRRRRVDQDVLQNDEEMDDRSQAVRLDREVHGDGEEEEDDEVRGDDVQEPIGVEERTDVADDDVVQGLGGLEDVADARELIIRDETSMEIDTGVNTLNNDEIDLSGPEDVGHQVENDDGDDDDDDDDPGSKNNFVYIFTSKNSFLATIDNFFSLFFFFRR